MKSFSYDKILPLIGRNLDYVPIMMNAVRELGRDNQPFNEPENTVFDKDSERQDIIERAEYLCDIVIGDPEKLIMLMPEVIGRFYQGQWAIYACSMTAFALHNIIRIYPEYKEKYLPEIAKLIEMVMTPTISLYDTMSYHEEALGTLDGNKSHMTYLSILAWMMTNYELSGGDSRYSSLLSRICNTLVRRMRGRRDLNLPSFPNGIVFLPDMMFTIVALKNYNRLYGNAFEELVESWLEQVRRQRIDRKTGLVVSKYSRNGRCGRLSGAYSALNTTCLALIDESFAFEQYLRLKNVFGREGKYKAIREYVNRNPMMTFDINAGPVIYGVSPTGTAFAMGAASYFGDWNFRNGLLRTAELAGKTRCNGGMRHYKLAEIMLTGEAITLAMRTMLK